MIRDPVTRPAMMGNNSILRSLLAKQSPASRRSSTMVTDTETGEQEPLAESEKISQMKEMMQGMMSQMKEMMAMMNDMEA